MHPKVPRDLLDISIAVVFGRSWTLGHFLNHWGIANAPFVFRKSKKHYPGNFRVVNFALKYGKWWIKSTWKSIVVMWMFCCWLEIAVVSLRKINVWPTQSPVWWNDWILNKAESSGYDLFRSQQGFWHDLLTTATLCSSWGTVIWIGGLLVEWKTAWIFRLRG